MRCRNCGCEIDKEYVTCSTCGAQIITNKRDPKIAAVISLIPGIGQIYNGEMIKGISFIILDIIFVITTIIMIGLSIVFPTLWRFTFIAVLMGFLFWIINIYDAYSGAKEKNG